MCDNDRWNFTMRCAVINDKLVFRLDNNAVDGGDVRGRGISVRKFSLTAPAQTINTCPKVASLRTGINPVRRNRCISATNDVNVAGVYCRKMFLWDRTYFGAGDEQLNAVGCSKRGFDVRDILDVATNAANGLFDSAKTDVVIEKHKYSRVNDGKYRHVFLFFRREDNIPLRRESLIVAHAKCNEMYKITL